MSTEKERFSERLAIIRGKQSRAAFAREIGVSEGAVRNYEIGSMPALDVAARIAKQGNVSLEWLIGQDDNATDSRSVVVATNPLPVDFAYIPHYSVEASAGSGSVVEQEEIIGHIAVDRRWFEEIGVNPNDCNVLLSRGDSMYPTIEDGAPMIIDRSFTELLDGLIFVINLHGDLVVKRVQRFLDGSFELVSDNGIYKPLKITQADLQTLRVIGRVRFVLKSY